MHTSLEQFILSSEDDEQKSRELKDKLAIVYAKMAIIFTDVPKPTHKCGTLSGAEFISETAKLCNLDIDEAVTDENIVIELTANYRLQSPATTIIFTQTIPVLMRSFSVHNTHNIVAFGIPKILNIATNMIKRITFSDAERKIIYNYLLHSCIEIVTKPVGSLSITENSDILQLAEVATTLKQ